MNIPCVISVALADIRRDPDPTSERVTQALMNMPAVPGETCGEWTHVRLADYEGWILSAELEQLIAPSYCRIGEACRTPLQLVAVITAPHASLYIRANGGEQAGTVYFSTALPLRDTTFHSRVQVALPGKRTAWLDRSTVDIRPANAPYPPTVVAGITDYARAFLGRPYLWGGTSWQGIDCSGLVQLCYRMGGYMLPRDAQQQHDFLTRQIERAEMQAGDLIFFGTHEITHVALALNAQEYIHAEGQNYHRVLINTFDRAEEAYYARLDEIVWDIKRVVL